ncbi:MAG TPA: hypothetical protein VIL20_03925, partial [Sandaracinaceae bacterium]
LVERSRAAWACAALSLLASFAWIGMGLTARRRLRDAGRWKLVLAAEGLSLIEGPRRRRVAWEDVEAIETNDDRLVVEIRVRGEAEPIVVEPRYGGLGVVDLEAAIRAAHEEATRRGAGEDAARDETAADRNGGPYVRDRNEGAIG